MIALRAFLTAGTLVAASAAIFAIAPATPSAAQSLANPRSELIDNLPAQPWLSVTERTEKGHRTGNPDAEAHLIAFISYSCSGCAQFARRGDGSLDLAAVGPGHISIEVRPVIRNSVDLVASLLAQCGEPSGFPQRHRALLYSQDSWWTKAERAPQSQKAIWDRRTPNARINAAMALNFDDTMRDLGLSSAQMSRCLRDEATAQKIIANDKADRVTFAITGTPSFALDGETLEGAKDWPTLASALQAHFRPKAQVYENGRLTTVAP